MNIKKGLLKKCQDSVDEHIARIHRTISNIEQSLNSETKSTAGDKHETGRAMLHLQREKAGSQLKEAESQKQILNRIKEGHQALKVALGTVVYTSEANYFIATALGEIVLNEERFFAISPASPIGQILMGKTQGDCFKFRGATRKIIKIL